MAKQFAPHIYRDWFPLFATLTPEQSSEVLKGIALFPEYDVKGVPLWDFFKSQLEKEYENFCERSDKARGSVSARWSNANECERIKPRTEYGDGKNCDTNSYNEKEICSDVKNEIRNDTNEYERIKTNTNEYDATRSDADVKNEIRNDTITEHKHKHKHKQEQNSNPPCSSHQGEATHSARRSVFIEPSVNEVKAYVSKNGYSVDAERFVNFYASKGWVIGKSPMKDWKAAVRTWEAGRRKAENSGRVIDFVDDSAKKISVYEQNLKAMEGW